MRCAANCDERQSQRQSGAAVRSVRKERSGAGEARGETEFSEAPRHKRFAATDVEKALPAVSAAEGGGESDDARRHLSARVRKLC